MFLCFFEKLLLLLSSGIETQPPILGLCFCVSFKSYYYYYLLILKLNPYIRFMFLCFFEKLLLLLLSGIETQPLY